MDALLDKKVSYFLSVVEEGSFSAAARRLYLTQSALSQQIAVLERELDLCLLDRSGYRPVLTADGKRFYEGCLELRRSSRALLTELHAGKAGRLRVGFTGAYENRDVISLLNSFRRAHSEYEVSYIKRDFEEVRESLLNGEVDLGFGLETTFRGTRGLHCESLYLYDMAVICSFDHHFADLKWVEPEQLRNEPFVILSKKNGQNLYRDYIKACRLFFLVINDSMQI